MCHSMFHLKHIDILTWVYIYHYYFHDNEAPFHQIKSKYIQKVRIHNSFIISINLKAVQINTTMVNKYLDWHYNESVLLYHLFMFYILILVKVLVILISFLTFLVILGLGFRVFYLFYFSVSYFNISN